MSEEIIFKRSLTLPVAIGDWTTLKSLVATTKQVRKGIFSFDRLGENELKQIHRMHYQFSEVLIHKISHDLKQKILLHSVVAEQTNYQSFMSRDFGALVQANFALTTGQHITLYYDLAFIELLLTKSLGGKDSVEYRNTLTEFDSEIAQHLLLDHFTEISRTWNLSGVPASVKLEFPKPELDPSINLKEGVVVITIEVETGKKQNQRILVFYSNKVLRQLLSQLSPEFMSENIAFNTKTLRSISVPVRIELGSTELTMNDVSLLEVGDVIQLDKSLDETVTIYINNTVQLPAQLGQQNGHIAVQILNQQLQTVNNYRAVKSAETSSAILNEGAISTEEIEESLIETDSENDFITEAETEFEDEIISENELVEETEDDLEAETEDQQAESIEDLTEDLLESDEAETVEETTDDSIDETLAVDEETEDIDDIFSGLDLDDDDDDEFSWNDEDEVETNDTSTESEEKTDE